MVSVRRALALSLIERYLMLVLALASNMALARLLTPEQIGIYSVSMAVLGLAQALRDFGIGSYLVQVRELDEEKAGTAFSLTMGLGATLFVATLVAAPFVGDYYGDPRVVTTLRICSLNFLLLPLTTVALALLRRALQFKRLLYVMIAASLTGAVASVGLAVLGLGVSALAWGAVAGNAATVVGLWLVRPQYGFPRPRLGGWRPMLGFGGQVSVTSLVNSLAMDMNDLVVAKVLGFQPVAVLSRAQGLMNMFNRDLMGAIRNVALPAFASAHRDGVALPVPYARSVALVTVFGWPFHTLVALYSLEVLHLLYGSQWHQAAALVPLFSLAGAVAATNALTPNLLTAIGRIDLVTRVELLLQPMRMVLIAGAAIIFKSIEACAIAFMASSVIAAPIFAAVRRHAVGDDHGIMRKALMKSAVVAAAAALPPLCQITYVGWGHTEPLPVLAWLPVAGLGAIFAAVAVQWTHHPLADESHFQRARRWLLRQPATPAPSPVDTSKSP
ncbi:lipopolysaccharide biosynthesis protein [Roseateles sp. NT4]|uniref:lipopolysaccharide biosynthesis protein n=1 Tax=Roseateles sp. NT4 TaxID=3453715 RepID=UPI003EE98F80